MANPARLQLLLCRTFCALVLFAVAAVTASAQRLTALASKPDWTRLDAFQETITREEFTRLLDTVYAPGGAARGVITVGETSAEILKTLGLPEKFTLRFAKNAAVAKRVPRKWRLPAELPAAPEGKPLARFRVALDPGHIGGKWALMEERSFARPGDAPVREGDMTLLVARLVAKEARALGAEVSMVRDGADPLSPFTVEALREPARRELAVFAAGEVRENYDGPRDPLKKSTVQWQAEKLLYRVAEIRERARIVNDKLRPDLVVCIHFNADDWADPEAPVFTERNDLHVLIHGCYGAGELHYDDQRFEMLIKLLNRSHAAELAAAAPVATALAKTTGLPPFAYLAGNAIRTGESEYLWARNLLASRLYECPSIYLEPWRMNHEETYARIQAGDYDGLREIAGKSRPSIFREYSGAIVEGLKKLAASGRRPR